MLKIDSQAMYKGLQTALLVECETLTDWLWTQVQSKAPPQVDRSMIHKEVVIVAGNVMGTVSAGGIGALTTEWGSGSLADESNPAWNEYTGSGYYNPSRFPYGHPITGRPAGDYTNLDNERMTSTGKMEGLNLEGFLPPQEPLHWMHEIVELSRPYILERLVEMIQVFPFHNYIHGEG